MIIFHAKRSECATLQKPFPSSTRANILRFVHRRYNAANRNRKVKANTMIPDGSTAGSRSARHSVTVSTASNKVVVAVKAEKVISRAALAWALTHVVHSSDCLTLIAVYCGEKTGRRKLWSFSRFAGDCSSGRREKLPERICEISESCSQMVLQFNHQIEYRIKIRVVLGAPSGAVADEAKSSGANWVILDKKLKQELKHCMEELCCNIVKMKGSHPKVLRLNLGTSEELQTPFFSAASSPCMDIEKLKGHKLKHSTPVSSPEEASTSTRITGEGSLSTSSFDTATSLFLVYEQNPLYELHGSCGENCKPAIEKKAERISFMSSGCKSEFCGFPLNPTTNEKPQNYKISYNTRSQTSKTLIDKFVQSDQETRNTKHELNQMQSGNYVNSDIRSSIPLGRTSSIPPPLCSLCQHKAPSFGKPPRQFSYKELEIATDVFSDKNFLAEGGYGVVHRGVLKDGQVVAVKQLKFTGSQADADFCREVRVLSCAQHRNVVLLIGFCIEGHLRVLVYEYVCNKSLDFHLHENKGLTSLDWNSRLKIAIGTARGLRYLHEDCRVGCIVHRDLRPNNILLTHDFEPLVADFGLVRWHSEWNMNTDNRVIGTSGYLAPEYVEAGELTYKVDIYAFGVVLLELITGSRISELQQFKGQLLPSEWFHPPLLLEPNHILENLQLLDSCLDLDASCSFTHQMEALALAAALCLRPDPDARPAMSKVLRVLEGGNPSIPLALDLNSVGNRSGHLRGLSSLTHSESRSHSRNLSH